MAGNPAGVTGLDSTCLPPGNTIGRLPAEVLFAGTTTKYAVCQKKPEKTRSFLLFKSTKKGRPRQNKTFAPSNELFRPQLSVRCRRFLLNEEENIAKKAHKEDMKEKNVKLKVQNMHRK